MPDTLRHAQKIKPTLIFLHMTLCTPVKIAKCAQYTMEALVPFFTQDAQRQVCFGLITGSRLSPAAVRQKINLHLVQPQHNKSKGAKHCAAAPQRQSELAFRVKFPPPF